MATQAQRGSATHSRTHSCVKRLLWFQSCAFICHTSCCLLQVTQDTSSGSQTPGQSCSEVGRRESLQLPQGPDPSLDGSLAGVHLPYLTPRVHQFSNFFPSLWGRYSIIIIWNKVIFYSEIWGALFWGHRAVFPESAKLHGICGHEPFCSSWTILSLTSQLPSPYKASWAPGELWPMT